MPKLQQFLTRHWGTLSMGRTALADIHRTSWASYPEETGGVLLGYRVSRDGLGAVVRHVLGPGPAAVHEPRRFEPDYDWQAAQVAELWTRDESLEYLGDWHTHPGGSATISPMDKDALRVIAASPDANQTKPVMLIVSLHPDRSRLGVTAFSNGAFKTLRVGIHRS